MPFLHVEPDKQYEVRAADGVTVAFRCDSQFAQRLLRNREARSVGRPGRNYHLRLLREIKFPRGAASLMVGGELAAGTQYTYITHFASGRSCHSLKRLMPDGSLERWPGE